MTTSPLRRPPARVPVPEDAGCPVVPPWSVILPAVVRAPALARARVEVDGCQQHGRYAGPAVGLLVEELVAYLTARGARWVTVSLACDVVSMRAEVSVARSGPVLRRAAAADVTWQLVDKVARRWGRHRDTDGESVWCVVPTGVLPARGLVVPRQTPQATTGWTASQPA